MNAVNVIGNATNVTVGLGSFCWWHVPQDVQVPAARAANVAEAYGFDREVFNSPSNKELVGRAAHSFHNRQVQGSLRRVTEKVRETTTHKVWGILENCIRGEEEVGFDQTTKITLNKSDGSVKVEGPLQQEFLDRYNSIKSLILDVDVRRFLSRVRSESNAINLREGSGGVYFIPKAFTGKMIAAQKVLDELDTGATIYLAEVSNTSENRETIWKTVEREIDKDITKVLADANRVTSRVSALASKDDQLAQLAGLMDVYSDIIGLEADYEDLQTRLSDASNEVAQMMKDIQKGKLIKNAKGGCSVKFVKAAIEILASTGIPMGYKEITECAIDQELITTKSKTPETIMSSSLSNYVKQGDKIERIARGVYQIAVE